MRHLVYLLAMIIISTTLSRAQTGIPEAEIQIKAAVMAAPPDKRDDATVLGYNQNGELVTLRGGSNEMICLADDPEKSGFSVSCYHKDLEPFMARGRELRAEGVGFQEVFNIREQEVRSGKLSMPEDPTTLHVLSGKDAYYDPESGEVKGANLRWVVYIPYATSESTGLPVSPPSPGAPWIMDPGTHRAHIMITPPAN